MFLRDVYAAEFRCSGVLVSTATEKVTSLMFAVPFESWATTPAAPYVFYAMFDLGCNIEKATP